MPETAESPVAAAPEPSRRIEDARSRPVVDREREVFQPERLDVLVHLRAFEALAGAERADGGDEIDWIAASDALAIDDVEPTVGELAAELLVAGTLDHAVVFGAGGRLVAGATVAAACVYGDVPMRREDTCLRPTVRSHQGLLDRGFTPAELRGIVATWLRRDPRAAIVIVDHEARCAEAALAEIERRYEVFYAEFDHFDARDAAAAGIDGTGSLHVLAVRVNPQTVASVLARHGDAIVGSFTGQAAIATARSLFDNSPTRSSSPSHARALRARRRIARRARVAAGLRALKS